MKNNAPLDIVSAYSEEDWICYSQVAAEGKRKEIEVILRLLDKISCNRNLKRNYKENQEEEYFYLQVKGSQKALKEDIGGLF